MHLSAFFLVEHGEHFSSVLWSLRKISSSVLQGALPARLWEVSVEGLSAACPTLCALSSLRPGEASDACLPGH